MSKLVFNERMKLSDIFDEYARFHMIGDNSYSVITFLAKKDLLDENKVKELLTKSKEEIFNG